MTEEKINNILKGQKVKEVLYGVDLPLGNNATRGGITIIFESGITFGISQTNIDDLSMVFINLNNRVIELISKK